MLDALPPLPDSLGGYFALSIPEVANRPLVTDLESRIVQGEWTTMILERFFPGAADEASPIQRDAGAATVHLGLCARLVSPWLGYAGLSMQFLAPSASSLRWTPDGTTSFPLALADEPASYLDPCEWADALIAMLHTTLVAPRLVRSEHQAWGNIASSINGAVKVLAKNRPIRTSAIVSSAQLLTERILGRTTFTGNLGQDDFKRTSCCLYYRLLDPSTPTERATCGDCVLRTRQG